MISVAMATFNGEKYIREQLYSIWNQTLKPDEIVISDDASTDRTIKIIDLFIKETNAPIILIQNKIHNGYIKNFFIALSYVNGEIVFLSDQDDIWKNKKVQWCTDVLQKNKFILALSTNFDLIDARGKLLRKSIYFPLKNLLVKVSYKNFLRYPRFPGMAMVIRKELALELLSNKKYYAAHDWQLNQFSALKGGLFYSRKSLTYYRQHSENTIGTIFTKGRQQRISMLSGLKRNLDSLIDLPPSKMHYVKTLKKTLEKRIELIQRKKIGALLIYNFIHLKFLSFRSLLGDLYAVFH